MNEHMILIISSIYTINQYESMRVFDGCTKFKSETKAFSDRGHEVVSLGIEGDVTICCDIRKYYPSVDDKYDFMTFHPPCTEFSKSNWRKGKYITRNPDMSIVNACLRIVETCKPRYWMIENPQGALRYFIGMPQVTINYGDYGHYCKKPTDLWGVFPWFWSNTPDTYIRGYHNHTAFRNCKKTQEERAMVPYGLSLAICKAIENDLKMQSR